ncbi:MAG TPA: LacI family DNA-binding transcriptional regulator [Terrimicrobiaceae bacterium]
MSVTLKEIANRTGVSPMTISRALRGIGSVKIATRKRVLQVAEEMGHFRSKGVVFPPPVRQGHTDHHLKLLLPYYRGNLLLPDQRLLTGLKQRLDETGGLLHFAPFRSLDDIITEARRHHVHGIVLRQILPADYLEKLVSNYPVVYAATDDFQAGVDSVSTNENRCAAQILNHLTLRGHRDIAFYGIADTQSAIPSREESLGAFALVDSSIQGARCAAWNYLAQTHACSHPLSVQVDRRDPRFQSLDDTARLGLRQLLVTRPQPTALVVATDSTAAAVVRGLREHGLRIPDDMSVISYGGTNEGRRQDPPITSLRLPLEQIGHTVPELVERRLAQPSAVPVTVLLEATLLEGGTVTPPQRQL